MKRTPKFGAGFASVERMVCLRCEREFDSVSIAPHCSVCKRKDMVRYVKLIQKGKGK